MFRNYLKTAWRNLWKFRLFSLLHLLGLIAGLTSAFISFCFAWSQFQVNRQLKHSEDQYILTTKTDDPNLGYELATFGALAKELHELNPQIVPEYYRFDGITVLATIDGKTFRDGLQVGDASLLKMYGFKLLSGDPQSALSNPSSIVISSAAAIKYFGQTDAVGKTISIANFSGEKRDYTVSGVLAETGRNNITQLAANYPPQQLFLPLENWRFFNREIDSWNNRFIGSFIRIRKAGDLPVLNKMIKQLLDTNVDPAVRGRLDVVPVPLTEYYLTTNNSVVKRMVYTVIFVAAFLLLMSLLNYVNVSISNADARQNEMGIRKVLGGRKYQLMLQYMLESLLLVSLAALASLLVYQLLIPSLESMLGKDLPSPGDFPMGVYGWMAGAILLIAVAAGIYPALIIANFQPVASLKGIFTIHTGQRFLKKALVGFQYFVALLVLIAAAVVSQQTKYFFGKQLGYDYDYVITTQVPRNWTRTGTAQMLDRRDQLAALPEVESVTLSYEIPDGANAGQIPVINAGADTTTARFMQLLQTDEEYVDTYKLDMLAGRFYTKNAADSGNVVINHTAAQALGYRNDEQALGQRIRVPGNAELFTVIGVSSDFHFGTMQQKVPPILFNNVKYTYGYRYFSIRVRPGNIAQSLASLKTKWKTIFPEAPFEFRFMDQTLEYLYATELQLKQAAYVVSILAFIMVLLAVFGLVTLTINRKNKEIGIRKVLGASVPGIVGLFLKDFLPVIFFAALVAVPAGWWLMSGWLNNYAYRINLTATPFLLAILLLGLVIFLLITIQVGKAALRNPARTLKVE